MGVGLRCWKDEGESFLVLPDKARLDLLFSLLSVFSSAFSSSIFPPTYSIPLYLFIFLSLRHLNIHNFFHSISLPPFSSLFFLSIALPFPRITLLLPPYPLSLVLVPSCTRSSTLVFSLSLPAALLSIRYLPYSSRLLPPPHPA